MSHVPHGRVVLGLAVISSLISCSTGTTPSAPVSLEPAATLSGPALLVTVASPSHLIELHLPQGWTGTAAATAQDVDEVSGPDGAITVMLSAIPVGIAKSDWIDSYLDIHAADFPSGCLSGGGAPQEQMSIGGDDVRLLKLDCLPGWMLIVAHDDRIYDLRFKASAGATPAAKAAFVAIAQGLVFLPGAIPSQAPSVGPSTM